MFITQTFWSNSNSKSTFMMDEVVELPRGLLLCSGHGGVMDVCPLNRQHYRAMTHPAVMSLYRLQLSVHFLPSAIMAVIPRW